MAKAGYFVIENYSGGAALMMKNIPTQALLNFTSLFMPVLIVAMGYIVS